MTEPLKTIENSYLGNNTMYGQNPESRYISCTPKANTHSR